MSVQPLTDREILIAQGKDPDAIDAQVEEANLEQVEEVVENEGGEGGEDAPGGKDAPPTAWYNDTTKTLASEYGLGEDDLKAFSGESEFKKTVAFLERQRSQLLTPDQNKQAQEQVQNTPDEAELDVEAYRKAGFDEETIKVVEAHNALSRQLKKQAEMFGGFERQVEELRQFEAARQHQSFCNEFHAICDTLEDGLVGRSTDKLGGFVPLSETADSNRRKIFDAYVELYQKDLERASAEASRTGKSLAEVGITPSRTLIEQAKTKALSKEIVAYEREKVQRDLQKQSKMRRPSAGASPRTGAAPAGASKPVDPVMALVNDPELIKFWNKSQG